MKKIIAVLFLTALAGGAFYLLSRGQITLYNKKENIKDKEVSIDGYKFSVEIADDQQERAKGLGNREVLCDSCSMIFKFPEKGKYSFWMKDMKFSLDIIWINGDRIVYIAKNINPDFKGIISPGIEADRVLEINAGLADKYGFKEGSRVITD